MAEGYSAYGESVCRKVDLKKKKQTKIWNYGCLIHFFRNLTYTIYSPVIVLCFLKVLYCIIMKKKTTSNWIRLSLYLLLLFVSFSRVWFKTPFSSWIPLICVDLGGVYLSGRLVLRAWCVVRWHAWDQDKTKQKPDDVLLVDTRVVACRGLVVPGAKSTVSMHIRDKFRTPLSPHQLVVQYYFFLLYATLLYGWRGYCTAHPTPFCMICWCETWINHS